jgi:transcriptional regulator with XRE-family HTH domain
MNLGNTLIELREAKGLKQKALAEKCQITQAYLSQIENDKKEPNLSTLKTISEILEIPLPLIFFLAIDEKDFPERKKEAFEILRPLIKNLIADFFIHPN